MRHRKKIAAALVAGLIGLGGWLAYPREAACAWCPSFTCYSSSMCGHNCTCIIRPGGNSGNCWGIGQAPEAE